MGKQSKFLRILLNIGIILLVCSIVFYIYNYLNYKNIKKMKENNIALQNELKLDTNKEQEIKNLYDKKNDSIRELQKEFIEKYGYDLTMSNSSVLENAIKYLEKENEDILNNAVGLINKYKAYYSGEYYNFETYNRAVNDFLSLTTIKSTESLSTNIYNDINITSFIEEAKNTGTIAYLKKSNADNKEVDTMLFLISIYSNNLNKIANDNSKIKEKFEILYPEVENLYNIYANLENYGLYTGSLSSRNLKELKNQIYELNRKYYENTGVINILRNSGEKNE